MRVHEQMYCTTSSTLRHRILL